MSFPATPVLDDFNRANQNPPSSSWTAITLLGNLAVVSNTCKANAAGNCGNYYNPTTYGPPCEGRITIVTKGGTGDQVGVWLRTQQPGSGLTIDGYLIVWQVAAGTDQLLIQRVDNGVATTLTTIGQEMNNGDVLGGRAIGSTITAWVNGVQVGSATDSTYAAAGNLVLSVVNTTFVLDDFGGGTVPVGPLLYGGQLTKHGILQGRLVHP